MKRFQGYIGSLRGFFYVLDLGCDGGLVKGHVGRWWDVAV